MVYLLKRIKGVHDMWWHAPLNHSPNNSSKGCSAGANFRNCSSNHLRHMSFDIHADFWPQNIVDSSAPLVTYFGILPDKDL